MNVEAVACPIEPTSAVVTEHRLEEERLRRLRLYVPPVDESQPFEPPQVAVAAKLLRHYKHLAGIQSGQFQPPIMVDIDPVDGVCNLDCAWCCQALSRASRPARFMSVETMRRLGPFCRQWGVKSWRISGDSEPLLNKHINVLVQSGFDSDIDIGLITNGVFLERLHTASQLTYLGVSLDATTARTWSRLKRASRSDFYKIIEQIKIVRQECPQLDLCIKFVRYRKERSLRKNEFSSQLTVLDDHQPDQSGNEVDAEELDDFARMLGCRPVLRDAYPRDFSASYQFNNCLATPLGGVFDASHNFHLCCDARSVHVLTDDYTRDDWQELPKLWGSEIHKEIIAKINPTKCQGCAKHKINEVLQHVFLTSDKTVDYQVNFI